ncbi:MAG: YeeE/YedE family protein [Deltaproteobacteria bacterium]|nr:MAG: YeeE/YedE family protein [Deltaproteobacteria bacterium]
MSQNLSALFAGLLFGLGLGISGMTMPEKVIGFLDLTHEWDPSLGFVMLAAVAVHLISFRLIVKRPSPVLGDHFGIPTRQDIDGRLLGGAALFGVGWALGGYCPGPGLVSTGSGLGEGLVFTASLTGGMLLFHMVDEAWKGREAPATA